MKLDDLGHVVGHLRQRVRHAEPEVAGVLEVPLGRRARRARARAGRGVVDLVVDVGDVVHERRVVAAHPQPRPQPHAEDERPRVADVRTRVDGRPAEVHAHRAGRRRQLDERLRVQVSKSRIDPPRASRLAAARRAPPRARGRCRAPVSATAHRPQVAADRLQLADDRLRAVLVEAPAAATRSSRKRSSVGARRATATDCGVEDRRGERPRLDQVVSSAERRHDRRPARRRGAASSSSESAASASTASERMRAQVELDIVRAADRAPRGSARTASAGCRPRAATRPTRRRRASRASCRRRRGSGRGGRTPAASRRAPRSAPGAAARSAGGRSRGHVGDAEVDVVDDARELVGRAAVLAQELDALEALAAGRRPPRGSARARSLCRTGPSSQAIPSQTRSSRIASSPPATFRAGSVSSIRRSIRRRRCGSRPRPSALPMWSEPVGLGAKISPTSSATETDSPEELGSGRLARRTLRGSVATSLPCLRTRDIAEGTVIDQDHAERAEGVRLELPPQTPHASLNEP